MPNGEDVLDQDANDPAEETADEQTEETSDADDADDQSSDDDQTGKPDAKAEAKPESKPSERPVYTMPVSKAQEEKARAVEKAKEEAKKEAAEEMKQLRDEYEAKLRESRSKGEDKEYLTDLERVATEHKLDMKAAEALLGVFRKAIPLPDMSKYDQIVKEKEIEDHKVAVSRDFDERVAPLIIKDNPQATPEHIREIKERIGELAFTADYNNYRLEDIYKINRDEFAFKNKISAESSGGRGTDLAPFKVLSDEDEIKLANTDEAAYGKYLKWLESQDSQYMDNA